MVHERKDSWTAEDDVLLAETVLNHIKDGGTQLAAFEKAAELLDRTSAACGFRWNSAVRKQFEQEIREAKQIRKIGRTVRASNSDQTGVVVTFSQAPREDGEFTRTNDDLDEIIRLANNQKLQLAHMAKQIEYLNGQLFEKSREITTLQQKLEKAQNLPTELTVNEDYRTLLQILQRARQIGAIDDDAREKHVFKMDTSGNIEFVG